MKHIHIVLILFSCCLLQAQEFKSINARTQIKGIVEAENELIFYGEGIIWTDKDGSVIHTDRLLKDLPSSSITDLRLDKEGNAWILTHQGIGLIKDKDNMSTLFKNEDLDESGYQVLYIDENGLVYTATYEHIYKLKQDGTKEIVHVATEAKELSYIKRMLIDKQGNIFVTAYRDMYKITPDAKVTKIKTDPRGKVNFQNLVAHEDGSITAVGLKQLLTLQNDSLVQSFHANDLVRGISLYASEFVSKDHYAILAKGGNLFIHKNGEWTNYIPENDLRPGNYMDDILLASDGQIWITMSEEPILHFNGSEWKQKNLVEHAPLLDIVRLPALRDGRQMSYIKTTQEFYECKDKVFTPTGIRESGTKDTEYVKSLRTDSKGNLYWSTKIGLNKHDGKNTTKLIANQEIHAFGVLEDKLIVSTNNLLSEFKNGKMKDISSQDHNLGSSDFKYMKIYQSYKDELILYTNRKRGQLMLYDGEAYTKVIDIEGKKIGTVEQVISSKSKTLIFTDKNGIAQYDETGFRWLTSAYEDPNKKRMSNYLCQDGAIWSIDNKGFLEYIKDGKHVSFKAPIKNLHMHLRAVVNTSEDVYQLYSHRDVLECNMK